MAGAYDFFAIISDFPTFHTYIDSIILVQTEQTAQNARTKFVYNETRKQNIAIKITLVYSREIVL